MDDEADRCFLILLHGPSLYNNALLTLQITSGTADCLNPGLFKEDNIPS